jgi:hypothetical protein
VCEDGAYLEWFAARMNTLVRDFYRIGKRDGYLFQDVLFLSECPDSWEEVSRRSSGIPRGWFELCRLPAADRIEFVRDFWLNLLPYHPSFHLFLTEFFEKFDDVGVVLSQTNQETPWLVEMIYSLQDHSSFFRGLPPGSEAEINELRSSIVIPLPRDYLAFLRIHNGFGMLSDLGLMRTDQIPGAKKHLADQYLWSERSVMMGNQAIDPDSLIPFYESYGLGAYQCFFNEWYPGSEMGNVYLSGIDYTISDYRNRKEWIEQMAFPTFLDWLAFYLQGNSVD